MDEEEEIEKEVKYKDEEVMRRARWRNGEMELIFGSGVSLDQVLEMDLPYMAIVISSM